MSHYTIRYTQKTRAEREAAAVEDARDWLATPERFLHVMTVLTDAWKGSTPRRRLVRQMYFALSFAGIQGLPAKALIRRALKVVKGTAC